MIPVDPPFAWEVEAGLSLVSIDLPVLPVFPALTAGLTARWRLGDAVGLGARYRTWLGYDHRLGPELDLGHAVGHSGWSVGGRVHPWVRVAGAAGERDGVALGGDVSTIGALLVTRRDRSGRTAITVEGGGTVQWLLFERIDGQGYVDDVPWYATTDAAIELAWADRWAQALAVRLEVAVPRAPHDPLTVLGVRPTLVVVGRFGAHDPSGDAVGAP